MKPIPKNGGTLEQPHTHTPTPPLHPMPEPPDTSKENLSPAENWQRATQPTSWMTKMTTSTYKTPIRTHSKMFQSVLEDL